MLTTEIRQTYGRLPEDAKQAILALSLLVSRIRSLPDDDRKDLFELMDFNCRNQIFRCLFAQC